MIAGSDTFGFPSENQKMPCGSPRQCGSKWGEIEEPDEGRGRGQRKGRKNAPGPKPRGVETQSVLLLDQRPRLMIAS